MLPLILAVLLASPLPAGGPSAGDPSLPAGCELSAGDLRYFQDALDAWATVTRDVLGLPEAELPWMILYSRTCAYHLAPDRTTSLGRSGLPVAHASLKFASRPVPVRVVPVSDTLALPNGNQIPARGLAFTSVYEEAGAKRPFFVTALPDVWPHDPKYKDDPEDWTPFVRGVMAHELVHTRQIVAIHARLEALQARFPTLPEDLDDDFLQRRLGDVPGLDASVRAEIALMFAAVAEPDLERARELAVRALGLVRARRTAYFGDSAEAYGALEDVFLNMEGIACWAALKLKLTEERAAPAADVLERFRGNKRWWSQEEGLALFLLIERFATGWMGQVFPPELAAPTTLLEAALERK